MSPDRKSQAAALAGALFQAAGLSEDDAAKRAQRYAEDMNDFDQELVANLKPMAALELPPMTKSAKLAVCATMETMIARVAEACCATYHSSKMREALAQIAAAEALAKQTKDL